MIAKFRSFLVAAAVVAGAPLPSQAAIWTTNERVFVDEVGVSAAYRVDVSIDLLEGGPEELEIQAPDGRILTAVHSGAERRGQRNLVWRGFLRGAPDLRAVLTVRNGRAAGRIETGDGVYEIRPHGADGHLMLTLDLDAFPSCAGGLPADPRHVGTAAPDVRGLAPQGNVIDVISLYTPQARNAAGGVANIEATIQAAVDNANTAFIDSNMAVRLSLVGTALANYNDSGDLGDDLVWLRTDPEVAVLRDALRADMVSLIVESPGCGIGYVMRSPGPGFADFAFQVTDRGCAVGNLTYAHEHGHNLGFEHDPANGTSPANASFPWSFAHFHDGSYRTVMSYSNQCTSGCTRVAHFSNPDILHAGMPTGITDQRDNARTGNVTGPIAATFRVGELIFTTGFEGSFE